MELLLTVVVSGVLMGLLAGLQGLALGLVMRASGQVNLAHGDCLVLGGLLGVVVAAADRPPLAVAVGLVATAALGGLVYAAVLGPLGRDLPAGGGAFLPALGVALLVRNADEALLPRGSRPVPALLGSGSTHLFGDYRLPSTGWWVVGLGLAVPGAVAVFLRASRYGARVRAVGDDAVLAGLTGLPIGRTLLGTFVVAGGIGGLAGTLFASLQGQLPVTLGWQSTLAGFLVAVLGGPGRPFGAVVAGLGVGLAQSVTAGYLTTSYRDVVTFGLLIGVLVLAPRGLLPGSVLREA